MKGNVRQLPSGSWELRYYLPALPGGKPRPQSKTVKVKRKSEAEQELRKILTDIDNGDHIEPSKLTVAQYLAKWLEEIKTEVQAKTHERYSGLVRLQLAPHLGHHKLAELRAHHIKDFQGEMLKSGRVDGKGGLAARTVLHLHRCLSEALNQAVKSEILARNPCDRVDEPEAQRKEMNVLDAEQTTRLLDAARGTDLYMPILIAAATGMRRGEVLALRWRDVDLDRGTLSVLRSIEQVIGSITFKRPKTKKSQRVIALPTTLVTELIRHKAAQAAHRLQYGPTYQDQGLILARKDGTPLRPDRFSAAFGEFMVKLDLPRIRFHDLRHGHISHLLQQKVPVHVVSARAGHSTAAMTLDVYSHIFEGMDQQAAEHIDAALRRGVGGG